MISVLMGADNTAPSTTVTNYNFVTSSNTSAWSTTETDRDGIISGSFDLANFYMEVSVAPGVGKSWTFTVMKNGSATALEVVISGTDTSATDSIHTVSYAAGDTISLRSVPSGTPTSTGSIYWNLEASGTGQPVVTSYDATISSSNTRFLLAYGSGTQTPLTTADRAYVSIPTSGTVSNFWVSLSASPGSGKSHQFTFVRNGVNQAVTVTVADAATTGSDTTHSFTVTPGVTSLICIESVPINTPNSTTVAFGWIFTPDIDGESFIAYGKGNSGPSTSVVNYEQLIGNGRGGFTATESNIEAILGNKTLRSLVAFNDSPGGVGKSYTWTIRKNGVDTALSVTNANTDTVGTDTGDVVFSQGDKITLSVAPAGSPTFSATNRVSCIVTVDSVGPEGAAILNNSLLLKGIG